jgi:hypothetical protein
MISRAILKTATRFSSKHVCQKTLLRGFAEVSTRSNLKVNHYSQLNTFHYADVFNAVAFASNSERMADVIEVAAPMMTDNLLALALRIMEKKEYQLGEGFHTKMLPFIRDFTKIMDRNHTAAFAETMVSMGTLGVKDEAYWAICREKLIDQGYHRYVPLRNLGYLIKALANVGQADAELMRVLGSQVIKHQAGLPADNLQAAVEGFEAAGIGAEAFKKALGRGPEQTSAGALPQH